jgi:hypothetical protein
LTISTGFPGCLPFEGDMGTVLPLLIAAFDCKIFKTNVLAIRGAPMSLDFQQLHHQVKQLGENAPVREQRLRNLREEARETLEHQAGDIEFLKSKVERAARQVSGLRCARPESEPLNMHYPLPDLPPELTLLAVDGSQITPDRHGEVEYYLINVGGIKLELGSTQAPEVFIESALYYGDSLYTPYGTVSEGMVTLQRDLKERKYLADTASRILSGEEQEAHLVTLTDGPLELWGAKEQGGDGTSSFRKSLEEYKRSLHQLYERDVTTAGYVDKPRADLLVRLLEVALLDENQLDQAGRQRCFRGVTDFGLLGDLLAPGERSAVFGLQSQSVTDYTGPLALHFFYLNVGREGSPGPARVEIPAWVAQDPARLDALHAVLVHQSQVLGTKPYPYLLHRAHEAAVVTYDEREQLTQMIIMELRRRGVPVGEKSYKQAAKDMGGRTRYEG